MPAAKRARHSRRNRQRWVVAAFASLFVACILVAAYVWYSKNSADTQQEEPSAFKTFTNHYVNLMKELNSSQTKTEMASQLDPSYNQTDLFAWQQSKMTFAQDSTWYEDPIQIISSGKGICVQWSVVYVSACLALGHQSRIVVAADTASWNFIHVWAEDYYNGVWVHVDPSDRVWNNPSRYQGWDWGKAIGSGVKIYAFDDSGFVNVTANYP